MPAAIRQVVKKNMIFNDVALYIIIFTPVIVVPSLDEIQLINQIPFTTFL